MDTIMMMTYRKQISLLCKLVSYLAVAIIQCIMLFPSFSYAASTTLVINEIMFNPSGTDVGNEWVELIARNDVNVGGYYLTNQGGQAYTFPSGLSLKAGEIIVVHMGRAPVSGNDLVGPVYHLYVYPNTGTPNPVEWFNNTGDDVLLRVSSGGARVDYMAYGTGSAIQPPGTGMVWSNTPDITYFTEGNTLGLIKDGIDEDDGSKWGESSSSEGLPNSIPSLSISKSQTSGSAIDRGNDTGEEFTITVTNNGNGPAYGIQIADNYPLNYGIASITSVQRNGVNVSYTTTDDGDIIRFANLPNLLNGDTMTVKLRLKALCDASPMFVNNTADVSYYGTPELSDTQKIRSITIDTETLAGSIYPDLIVTHKNGAPYSYSGVPEVDVGDVLTFKASIYNLNAGKLYDIDAYATWNIDGSKPDGMTYAGNLSCNSASSPPTTCSFDGNKTVTINRLSAIDGNTATPSPYYGSFDLQVAACENLIVRFYVTDKCAQPVWTYMETSPKVIVKNAVIDYTLPNPITINYGTTNTINIPITNSGSGNARNFVFDTDLNTYPVTISNLSPNWTYNSSDGTFAYSQIIGPGTITTLSFDISATTPCINRTISGPVLFEPSYKSGCGDWFYPPRKFTTLNTGNIPSVSISKTSNPATYAYIGQSVTYTVTLTTQNAAGLSGNIVVTDNVPSSSVTVTGASATAGTVNRSGNNITWTIPSAIANGQTLTITGNILNDPCIQGTTSTNTASFTVTDIAGCVLTGSDSATLYLNLNPGGTVTQQKTVSPSPVEACNSSNLSTVTNNYSISAGVTGTWNGSIFDDDMSNGRLCYVSGSAQYNFNSGGWTNIPSGRITQLGGHLTIDLSFLGTGNVENSSLAIRYQVYVCESELAGASANFVTLSDLFINGNDQSCVTYQGHYNQFLIIPAQRANVTAGISLNSSTVEDCGEYTATITVNNPSGLTYYDLVLEIPTTNYEYLGSLTRTGFDGLDPIVTTPANKVVFSFDSTGSPDPLTQGGTLQFRVRNKCGTGKDISVTGTAKTRYESGALPTACCSGGTCGGTTINLSGTYSPVFENKGDLVMTVTPERYPVNTASLSWKIYITNRGSGTAYNVEVKDVLGPNLEYHHSTINGSPASPTVSVRGVPSDFQTITWTIGDIPMKEMRVIEVFVESTGYSCNSFNTTSQITTTWGCGAPFVICQTLTGAGPANFEYPEATATVGTIVGTATICADTQIKIRYKNTGITDIYYSELLQDFQRSGMTFISGTAQFSPDDVTYSNIADPIIGMNAYGGQTLTWKGYGSGIGYVSQLETIGKGKTVYIRFNATTTCDLVTHPDIKASGSFQKPCQKGLDPSIPSNRTSVSESVKIIPYEKASLTATVMLRNVTTNPSGAFTNGNVYAAHNDEVEYRVVIRNTSATATAQNVTLQDILPPNLTFISISSNTNATLPSPGCTLELGGITGGSYPNWNLQNVSPNRCQQYFIRARVTACQEPASNSVTVNYGCPDGGGCQFINPARGDHGTYGKLITMPSTSYVSQLALSSFTTCGGDIRMVVENTGAKTKTVRIKPSIPTGWEYDTSGGTSVVFTPANPHTVTLDASDLHRPVWEIDFLDTNDRVTLTFHVKGDGNYCDTDRFSDPPPPPGTITVTTEIEVTDSCNAVTTRTSNLNITPTYPDVDIVVTANPLLVTTGGTTRFSIALNNAGNSVAQNLNLVLYLGNGFTITGASGSGIINNTTDPRTVTWDNSKINGGNGINPGVTLPAFTVDVIVGTGNLQAYADIDGWCKNAVNANFCTHSFDRDGATVAGLTHAKDFYRIKEPGTFNNSTNPPSGTATYGNVVEFDIKVSLFGEGTYSNFYITDDISSSTQMAFVDFWLDGNNDGTFVSIPFDPTYSSADGGLRARYTSPLSTRRIFYLDDTDDGGPAFTVLSGDTPKNITIRVRIQIIGTIGNLPNNDSYVDFTYNNGDSPVTYANASYPSILRRLDRPVRIYEPRLTPTKSYPGWGTTYNSTSPMQVGVGDPITYTVVLSNSHPTYPAYTSPAYDIVVRDTLPYGMRQTTPVINDIFIESITGNRQYDPGERRLTSPSDYTMTYNSTTGQMIIILNNGTDNENPANLTPPLLDNRLLANESLVIIYTAKVDSNVGPGLLTMDNSVNASYSSIRGNPISPETERNRTTENVTTRLTTGSPRIDKEGSFLGSSVVEGDIIFYTLSFPNPPMDVYLYGDVNNAGGTNYEFSDIVPNGLTVLEAFVTITSTRFCEDIEGVIVPPYKATMPGSCRADDRVFAFTLSGARNRNVLMNFNKLYPGDYMVVTIKAKINPTFDDGALIPDGTIFSNQASITVYTKPPGVSRIARTYTSNIIINPYEKLLTITPDRSGQTTPNSWVTYEHTVNNLTSQNEDVCFSIASLNGWSWFITDESGNILTNGATKNSLTIPANGSAKIYIKYFVPSDVPIGTVEGTTILLNRYASGCQIADIYDFVLDTTTIQLVSMKLSKLVRKCLKTDMNSCDAFVEKNQAEPCDYLEYQISFFNPSSNDIQKLQLNDIIPAHTDFINDAYGTNQDVYVHAPDGTEFYKSIGVFDTLQVDLTSDIPILKPGESGWIRYKVRVQGNCL